MDLSEAGALLYWCQGSKREEDYLVEFVNSDPKMISIFMKYLRAKGVDENRLRIRMGFHVQDESHWPTRCRLHCREHEQQSLSKKHLPHGTMAIRYSFMALLVEIKRDISAMARGLLET